MISRLTIRGMRAVHTVRAFYTALSPIEGIVRLEINLGGAVIEHDGRVTQQQLHDAAETAGLEITEIREERRRLPLLSNDPGLDEE
jgi:hypothetical protein